MMPMHIDYSGNKDSTLICEYWIQGIWAIWVISAIIPSIISISLHMVKGNNDPYEPYLLIKLLKPLSQYDSAKSPHFPYTSTYKYNRGIVYFFRKSS
jgi:hypothetical protein